MTRSVQITLTLVSGAEPWYRVRHSWGTLFLPVTASLQELDELVQHKVSGKKRCRGESSLGVSVRVPLERLQEVRHLLGS